MIRFYKHINYLYVQGEVSWVLRSDWWPTSPSVCTITTALEPVWTWPCRNLDKILVTPMISVLVGRPRPQTQEPNRLYRSLNCGFGTLNTVVARLWCNALGPWDKSQAFNSASYAGRRESVKVRRNREHNNETAVAIEQTRPRNFWAYVQRFFEDPLF